MSCTVITGVGSNEGSLLIEDPEIIVIACGSSAKFMDKAIAPHIVEESPELAIDDQIHSLLILIRYPVVDEFAAKLFFCPPQARSCYSFLGDSISCNNVTTCECYIWL